MGQGFFEAEEVGGKGAVGCSLQLVSKGFRGRSKFEFGGTKLRDIFKGHFTEVQSLGICELRREEKEIGRDVRR